MRVNFNRFGLLVPSQLIHEGVHRSILKAGAKADFARLSQGLKAAD
jgi:hypothetical protein